MLLPVNEMCIYTYSYIFVPLSYNAIIGFAVFRNIYYIWSHILLYSCINSLPICVLQQQNLLIFILKYAIF